ncbi:hypothetical protein BDN67DRAFT_985847 [Paxillus ammoniavirescens]|nr:hypothetical protein BDN67DRAFT_985847 [Paxillus ammoniavirescens]
MNGFRFNKGRRTTPPRSPANPDTNNTTSGERSAPNLADDTWDDVDLSSTEYARRGKELMRLINDLRSMGAETIIDLPSIVVIGGQSAGKSSLVEAVSGVNVPRDSGTCTRCPMECTMSSSAKTWSSTIKLRFDYDSSGRPLVRSKEVAFGAPITERDDLRLNICSCSLPKLKQDVEQLLAFCLEDLGALPAPLSSDPQVEVLRKVNDFCSAFKGIVDGTGSDKGLAQRNRALYSDFKRDIRGTAPDFRPFERPSRYKPFDALEPDETLGARNPRVRTMGVIEVRKVIRE